MDGALLFRQLANQYGVDGQGKGGCQRCDGGPVEFHRPEDQYDAGKTAEYGGDTQRGQFLPEQENGERHDEYGGGVEDGVGGGQGQVAQGDDHAQDARQVDVGPESVDLQASEKILPVQLACQGQQECQCDQTAQEGKLEHRSAGFEQFYEYVRDQRHGIADDQQQNGTVYGFS